MDERLPASAILRDAATNSTAHGICRVADTNRSVALRAFWLAAFLCLVGVLVSTCVPFVRKLNNPGVKSNFEAEKVEFEFPDVYFCNSLQAAGSFVFCLNQSEADQVKIPFYAAQTVFDEALKSLNASQKDNETLSELRLLSSIQSLSYKVLADIVGQRKLQTFYGNYGIYSAGTMRSFGSPVAVDTMYHPNHLKCFRLSLTDAELVRMRSTSSRLELNLLLDPYFFELDRIGLFSKPNSRLPTVLTVLSGRSTQIFPFDWDLENPVGFDRGSGMYMYLTPRGQYPSRLTSNVISLAPGSAYDLAISMRDSQMIPTDFPGQCVEQHNDPVLFFNPYSGSPDAFSYSEAHCYYSEIARDRQRRYNCSPSPDPTPWEFRSLALCLNVTAAESVHRIHRNMRAAIDARTSADSESSGWDRLCSAKRLCKRRAYSVTSAHGMWPNQASLTRLVNNILESQLQNVDRSEFRSLDAGVKAINIIDKSLVLGYEEQISRFFQRAAVSVVLRTQASYSPLTTFSLDYGLSKFIADIGSALGLYIGCSLLTLLEVFELLHNVVRYASCCKGSARK